MVGDPYDKKGTVACRFHFNKAVPHFLGWQLVSLKQKGISKSSSQFDPTIEPQVSSASPPFPADFQWSVFRNNTIHFLLVFTCPKKNPNMKVFGSDLGSQHLRSQLAASLRENRKLKDGVRQFGSRPRGQIKAPSTCG